LRDTLFHVMNINYTIMLHNNDPNVRRRGKRTRKHSYIHTDVYRSTDVGRQWQGYFHESQYKFFWTRRQYLQKKL